jgi:GDP-L-fucose synthase
MMGDRDAKIYVAGHKGLVGSALMRCLHDYGYHNLITRTVEELDLRDQHVVRDFFMQEHPEYVFLAAAKVGGIQANSEQPVEFLYDNLMIASNSIHSAHEAKVHKLLFLGSSCIYPRLCFQPMMEDYLLTGALEPTNEPYALAKIAGIKLCQAYNKQYGAHFISCMPTNLYGPGDHFNPHTSHVIPALITKMCDAQERGDSKVVVWGTGTPRREFLFVDDCAQALVMLMQRYDGNDIINVGVGEDISIMELAQLIQNIVGYKGELFFDSAQPDGTPRKLLNVAKINALGWYANTSLSEGLQKTIAWYKTERKMIT